MLSYYTTILQPMTARTDDLYPNVYTTDIKLPREHILNKNNNNNNEMKIKIIIAIIILVQNGWGRKESLHVWCVNGHPHSTADLLERREEIGGISLVAFRADEDPVSQRDGTQQRLTAHVLRPVRVLLAVRVLAQQIKKPATNLLTWGQNFWGTTLSTSFKDLLVTFSPEYSQHLKNNNERFVKYHTELADAEAQAECCTLQANWHVQLSQLLQLSIISTGIQLLKRYKLYPNLHS